MDLQKCIEKHSLYQEKLSFNLQPKKMESFYRNSNKRFNSGVPEDFRISLWRIIIG